MHELNRREFVAAAAASALCAGSGFAAEPRLPERSEAVLNRSDVAFMYQADRKTYEEYGATVLAWGGTPTPRSLEEAKGVRFFGSVGMVTEFARYYDRFPQTYEQGLCRDVFGKPVKVPWLTDMQHEGIPYWWCCTQQPQFRQYLRERVAETVKAGAQGVHIDDHLGTSGGLWLGVCFCERCVDGFRAYLSNLPSAELAKLAKLGITDAGLFDFRAEALKWASAHGGGAASVTLHPLWPQWTIYLCRAAAAFMLELRQLAAETGRRRVPIGANAGLLWPRHLSDYKAVDLFSAETDHGAEQKKWIDTPLVAYRLADAVGKPYAATASGGDWASVKAHNTPGLVRGWIALGYAAGHCLMAPHHQWCYTPEKGTHWYDGPAEKYSPLYRFVRDHGALFDGYEAHADLAVVMPHRSFVRDSARWASLFDRLSASNISYRILLAGDEIVDHPLTQADLSDPSLLALNRDDLLTGDAALVDSRIKRGPVFQSVEKALAGVRPSVTVTATARVLALPRVKPGSAAIHLVNRAYDADADDATTLQDVQLTVDLRALGLGRSVSCRWITPGSPPVTLVLRNGTVRVPSLGLWGILLANYEKTTR